MNGEQFYCIYSGREHPIEVRSLEHIVPYSLGGPGEFGTSDVSERANSDAGMRDLCFIDEDKHVLVVTNNRPVGFYALLFGGIDGYPLGRTTDCSEAAAIICSLWAVRLAIGPRMNSATGMIRTRRTARRFHGQ